MVIDRVKVGLGKKISRKDAAENWGSWEIFYGAEASLGPGETIELALPALDAKVRELLGDVPGFNGKKKLLK